MAGPRPSLGGPHGSVADTVLVVHLQRDDHETKKTLTFSVYDIDNNK